MLTSSLLLAQAIPPLSAVLLAGYLLFGVPAGFLVAAAALVMTFLPGASRRAACALATGALALAGLNAVLALIWQRMDRHPVAMGAEDLAWAATLAGSIAVSAIALWRAAARGGRRIPSSG